MKKRYILASVTLFLMGIGSGYMLSGIKFRMHKKRTADAKEAVINDKHINRLGKKLRLSKAQKESVRNIVNARRREIKDLKAQFRPRYMEIRENLKKDIQVVLNEQQRTAFRNMTEEAEKNLSWTSGRVNRSIKLPDNAEESLFAQDQDGDAGLDVPSDKSESNQQQAG